MITQCKVWCADEDTKNKVLTNARSIRWARVYEITYHDNSRLVFTLSVEMDDTDADETGWMSGLTHGTRKGDDEERMYLAYASGRSLKYYCGQASGDDWMQQLTEEEEIEPLSSLVERYPLPFEPFLNDNTLEEEYNKWL